LSKKGVYLNPSHSEESLKVFLNPLKEAPKSPKEDFKDKKNLCLAPFRGGLVQEA
jgi:hypothetical protein